MMFIANVVLAAPPNDLSAEAVSDSRIDLSWTDSILDPTVEDGYKIERDDGGGFLEIGEVLNTDYDDGGPIEYIDDTGLSEFTEYTYHVRAFKGANLFNPSNEAIATTKISPPSNLVATAVSTSQIDLSWTNNSGIANDFEVERNSVVIGTVTGTTYSDTGLSPGTTYTYVVRAFVGINKSDDSNEASATTLAPNIDVDPPEGDFGIVDIGEYEIANYRDITFEVSNVGDSGTVLIIDDITLTVDSDSEFSILSGNEPGLFPIDLEIGESHLIEVRFHPTELIPQDYAATLQIDSNDPDPDEDPLDVSLYGTGNPLDLIPPEIMEGLNPPNGSILDLESREPLTIPFSESMNTESVLKNSEFVRINITDDVTEIRASLCTFLYWFGNSDEAGKYFNYGCGSGNPEDYGIALEDQDPIDITFNEPDNDTLTIDLGNLWWTLGEPNKPIGSGDTEYLLRILVNGATDLSGNVLALNHLDYTYFLTQQVEVEDGETDPLLHDNSLVLTINGLSSSPAILTAHTYFPDSDGILPRWDEYIPSPLWYDFGKIGFIKAFHLELEDGISFADISIQVQYDDSDVPAGYEESPRLYQVNDKGKWELLVGSSVADNTVSYDGLTELGDFAVMWGAQYGDVLADGVIDDGDITVYILDIAQIREIFAPAEGAPSDDLYMRDFAGNIYCPDIGPGDIINPSDTQEAIQFFVGILDHFTIFDPPCAAPMIASHSPSAHRVFLSNDALSHRVSVILDDATNVFAADVELTYDARLLKISEVSKTLLTSDSFMEYNDRNPGKLRSVLVNGLSLNGSGSLIDVQFELMPGANSTAAFDSIKLTKVELNAGLVKATLDKLPQKLTLLQNYPNPFNPETWIPYELNQTANVEVRIYNINGRLVRHLPLGLQMPGSYIAKDKAVYWDGANDSGEKVSSGVYFYQLKAGEKSLVRKMVIMK